MPDSPDFKRQTRTLLKTGKLREKKIRGVRQGGRVKQAGTRKNKTDERDRDDRERGPAAQKKGKERWNRSAR